VKQFLSISLNLCLGLFLADAAISFLDATLILFLGLHVLTAVRVILSFLAVVATIAIYVLMAITPMIPKRFFLPIALFNPLAMLAAIPFLIYRYAWFQQLDWVLAFCQVIVGLGILFWVRGGLRLGWPLLSEDKLRNRRFSWLNLSGFVLVNIFALLPGVVLYLALCASLAVDHFSASFLGLHSDRLTVRAKKFVRDDGKTIQLIPMMHIGESSFYNQVSKSFPTNSVVLLEGVTDHKHLLKHELSYKRAATSLGLTEQHEEFVPTQGELRQADIDVAEFSESSIDLLNLATLLHSKGFSVQILLELFQKCQTPVVAEQLQEDLLTKRNQHLLKEIKTALQDSEHIVVPWGAGHMPGIAREIQKSGFVLDESREYTVVNFRSVWKIGRSKRR
jgi:hypothetical protein